MSKQKQGADLVRLVSYSIVGLIALQFPLAVAAIGSGQKFTAFEFLAPVSGMLFGPWVGAVQVIVTKLINLGLHNTTLSLIEFLRLFPLAFAAIYFGMPKRFSRYSAIIAILAIIAFVVHPIGRQVWFYALYWFIPVVTSFIKKNPITNALGATFTAHAVGGALFIWAFNTPKAVWLKLIPVVAAERAFFALGIIVTAYLVRKVVEHRWSKLTLTAKLSRI